MSEDIINQAISESVSAETSPPVEIIPETKVPEEKTPTETPSPEDIPFPKKAVNALSRRDKQIGKLQAQLAAERSELAKYREQQSKVPTNNSPSEDSYDNYGEYLKAVARHEAKQELSQVHKQQEEQQITSQQETWVAERSDYAIEKAKSAIESISDYKQLFMENADILQSLPPHIERAFFEAEEPALAFYALAKEGKLDALMDMSPARAAIEIGKAEMRGETLSKARTITKAPAPIEALKTVGGSTKTLDTMNQQQLMDWVNKK